MGPCHPGWVCCRLYFLEVRTSYLVVLTRDKDHLDGSKNTVKTLHCEGATRHTLSTHRHMHTK